MDVNTIFVGIMVVVGVLLFLMTNGMVSGMRATASVQAGEVDAPWRRTDIRAFRVGVISGLTLLILFVASTVSIWWR